MAAQPLAAGVERGLYVETVMNTARINPISGDYSVSAKAIGSKAARSAIQSMR